MFRGRELIIATKHEKEKVIAPIFEKELQVRCFVNPSLNTDFFGTFTGEIERKDDPVTTLRNKCLMAMDKYNFDLGIASEGSFGPHPTLFFVNGDDEFLIFIDKKNKLEIIARELSTDTNFNGAEIKTKNQLKEFAKQVLFPSHALILRNEKNSQTEIIKGIKDWQTLYSTFNKMIKEFGTAYIETDMRAMHNPTRMKVIEKAALKLVDKINTFCPKCGTPGLGITDTKKGLPCSFCNFPTSSTLFHIYQCNKCNYIKEEKYPHNKYTEDPMYCDICNP